MHDQTINALLIINPNSRKGAETDINTGIELLESSGFKVIQTESTCAKNTSELIDQHQKDIDVVIIGGGDGSINSAAEALYTHKLTLAILPLGTANDLARSLALPTNLTDAFKVIAENKRCKMDLGVANGRYFFNVANMGLGVGVSHELTPEVKKKWGVFSYLKAVLAAFKNNRTFRADITVDDKCYRMYSIQLAVGNGRFYGGGNVIDENATIDDGMLNLYSLQPQSFWALLLQAPLLRSGKHEQAARSFCAAGKRISIEAHPHREVHADGEPVTRTPVVFEIIPQALDVIRPEPVCAAA